MREEAGVSTYAKIILDSVGPTGKRLTTIECRYPRFIHSEVMTHRDRARNAASSRAIPVHRMISAVESDPVVPVLFGSEQRGMQTGPEIARRQDAEAAWLEARDHAVESARKLAEMGVHKSIVNRLLEPFAWIAVVMTATEWQNFFRLRCHEDAEVHFQQLAYKIRQAMDDSKPTPMKAGEWHMPYIMPDERQKYGTSTLLQVSAARCARVSYLTHDGRRDIEADLRLFNRLVEGSGFGHWSPMEHQAMALKHPERSGPFIGWLQYRKGFEGECADNAEQKKGGEV